MRRCVPPGAAADFEQGDSLALTAFACAAQRMMNVVVLLSALYREGAGVQLPKPVLQRAGWAPQLARALAATGRPVPEELGDAALQGPLPEVSAWQPPGRLLDSGWVAAQSILAAPQPVRTAHVQDRWACLLWQSPSVLSRQSVTAWAPVGTS